MSKKKRKSKHPKLPNGYGSIKYLGAKPKRRCPYAVHPPVTEYDENGKAKSTKPLCYVDSWFKAFTILTAYNAGNYYPGYELTLEDDIVLSDNKFINEIIMNYSLTKSVKDRNRILKKTFADVYEEFYTWKFEQPGSKRYAEGTKKCLKTAFKRCEALHDKPFVDLRYKDLQDVIDKCTLKRGSKESILTLIKQMYKYADMVELIDKNYAQHVRINTPEDDEHGVPFSKEELTILWENKDHPVAELLLILCYSGFRIGAMQTLTVNLEEGYFQGGIKTASSKNRIVPIHSRIRPLVETRIKRDGSIMAISPITFRRDLRNYIPTIGISKHTPHDCRHTFSMLCEKYGVRENDRKRMLGHAFKGDITNSVYGHRDLESLRKEIEKIQ